MMMMMMRRLSPNQLDDDDKHHQLGLLLDTVLEVPLAQDMFNKPTTTTTTTPSDANANNNNNNYWHKIHNLVRAADRWLAAPLTSPSDASSSHQLLSTSDFLNHHQFMLLLKLVCSPTIPCRPLLPHHHALSIPIIKIGSIQASTAKYIVQQYVAATGGLAALNAVNSMYAMGQVKLEIVSDALNNNYSSIDKQNGHHDQIPVMETNLTTTEATGGFVLWRMNPNLWFLELVMSGNKISAGSDGKITWSQSSSNTNNASRGPPRPLRRLFQGLDPGLTADLFLDAVCIGERTIQNDNCFILKLETSPEILKAHSSANTEIVHHTIWGYFSQRSGLLIQFEDSKLIRMKTSSLSSSSSSSSSSCGRRGDDEDEEDDDVVFYEASMESVLDDYRYVDGINIAHDGRTSGTLFRYGKSPQRKWKLEETWRIEEVDFKIEGLSQDYFLPPALVDCDNKFLQGNDHHI